VNYCIKPIMDQGVRFPAGPADLRGWGGVDPPVASPISSSLIVYGLSNRKHCKRYVYLGHSPQTFCSKIRLYSNIYQPPYEMLLLVEKKFGVELKHVNLG
jgi:hypothetical protein